MRKLVVALLVCLCCSFLLDCRTVPVSPGSADRVTQAIRSARPGDIIELRSGTYRGTIEVRASGKAEQPIVITAAPGASVTIDGGLLPDPDFEFSGEPWGDTWATRKMNVGIHMRSSKWVVIRGLRFINCWSTIIFMEESSYISIQDCDFDRCGQTAV